jgi:alkyl sulfatase BDS1-like metallo-beta-lactamase superfamily hydrolase
MSSLMDPAIFWHYFYIAYNTLSKNINEHSLVCSSGLNVTFIHVPGETADQMAVWLPDRRVLLAADDVYKTFPNLYAVRGTPPRDVAQWSASIRRMRQFNAEHLVPSHTHPVSGQQQIYDLLTVYGSAIQLVHDQAVRLANRGLHPDEIAKTVRLDPTTANHPYLKQLYGTVEWSTKAVYDYYFGWFSGDSVDLIPLTPSERSSRLVRLLGDDELLDCAESALKDEDVQWALELSSHVHRVDKSNNRAKDLRLRALQRLASVQTNPVARNYLMTAAISDLGLVSWKTYPNNVIHRMDMRSLLNLMKIRLLPDQVKGVNLTVGLNFTDINEAYRIQVVYSVMTVDPAIETMSRSDASYDVIMTTTSVMWRQIMTRESSPLWAYIKGDVKVDGSILTLRRFMSYFNRSQ